MKKLNLSPNMQAALWYRAGASYDQVMRAFPLCKISDVQYNALIGRGLIAPVGAHSYILTVDGRSWITEQTGDAYAQALDENIGRYPANQFPDSVWEQAWRMKARAGLYTWPTGMIALDEREAHEMDRRLDEADIIAARLGFDAHSEALAIAQLLDEVANETIQHNEMHTQLAECAERWSQANGDDWASLAALRLLEIAATGDGQQTLAVVRSVISEANVGRPGNLEFNEIVRAEAERIVADRAAHEANMRTVYEQDHASAADLDCPKITADAREVLWKLVLVDAALLAGVSDDVLAGMVSVGLVGYVEADGMTPHFVATPVGVRALREHDYRVALRREEAMAAAIECGFAVRVANA